MPLRLFYRWMLLAWLVLVFLLSIFLANAVDSNSSGNLVTFLFSRPVREKVVIPDSPLPPPTPAPVAEPQKPVPVPEGDWVEMPRGNQVLGKGLLDKPEVKELESGEVELTFPVSGTLGDVFVFKPDNARGLSVDLLGTWSKNVWLDRKMKGALLSRLQIGRHPRCLRVSAISAKPQGRLDVKVERKADSSAIRVRFFVLK